MARRRCQYCTRQLGRFAKLLFVWTCNGCAYRMSMGTSPSKPPAAPSTAKGCPECTNIKNLGA